jgi:uncharacterized membrane protein YkoI
MRVLLALLLLLPLVWLSCVPALADRDDHERVRNAVQAGEILPLRTILDRAAASHPGEFVAAELEEEHGKLVYEIKLLTPAGRVLEVLYDARTGEPLGEGKEKRRR